MSWIEVAGARIGRGREKPLLSMAALRPTVANTRWTKFWIEQMFSRFNSENAYSNSMLQSNWFSVFDLVIEDQYLYKAAQFLIVWQFLTQKVGLEKHLLTVTLGTDVLAQAGKPRVYGLIRIHKAFTKHLLWGWFRASIFKSIWNVFY